MSESDNLIQAFNGFLQSRGCSEEYLQRDQDYAEQEDKVRQLFEHFKTFLPEEEFKTYERFIDDNTFLITLGVQSGYRQGFTECFKIIFHTFLLDH